MTQDEITTKAKRLIEQRLEKAAQMTEAELFEKNLRLPPQYKYGSVREMQTVMVKGAFDALAFTVELGLLTEKAATDYWKELHARYAQLWPQGSV